MSVIRREEGGLCCRRGRRQRCGRRVRIGGPAGEQPLAAGGCCAATVVCGGHVARRHIKNALRNLL